MLIVIEVYLFNIQMFGALFLANFSQTSRKLIFVREVYSPPIYSHIFFSPRLITPAFFTADKSHFPVIDVGSEGIAPEQVVLRGDMPLRKSTD